MKIAVYGASGHTGRQVAAGLRKREIETVLMGRDEERLREVDSETEIRAVGLGDPEELADALRDCDVVVSCVAPFVVWGEPVVRAAIAAGTHYVDTTGEQSYIQRIFDIYREPAERAGVSVVPMVNDGGFLVDLLVSITAGGAPEVEYVVVAHRFADTGGLSRGSGRTAVANTEMFKDGGVIWTNGEWRADTPARCTSILFPGTTEPLPVVKFALPEIATIPRHIRARHVEGVAEAELVAGFAGITPELVEMLPENPPADGRFALVAEVDGVRGVIEGSDTYRTAAAAAVEAAYRLGTAGAKPGVLAPAQAFDPVEFLDSFASQGVHWSTG
jgi:short subunit dehydrogenase-like uncharacterized protein